MKKIATLIALATMISFGCNQSAQSDHGHDHGPEGHSHDESAHEAHEQEVFEVEEDSAASPMEADHSHVNDNVHDHHNH